MQLIDPKTGKLRLLPRLVDWSGRWLLPLLILGTGISGGFLTSDWDGAARSSPGLATWYQFWSEWIGAVFVVCAVSSTLITILQSVMNSSLKSLQAKVDLVGSNFRTLCDGFMSDLATQLGIGEVDQSRVSIYAHDGDNTFFLCGRYSPNPDLKRPGRPSYPDDQGCIGKGWREGWWFENRLGVGGTYANTTQRRYSIQPEVLQALIMKSRMFGVQRIDCHQESVGVIVVESMTQDRFQEDGLRDELSEAARNFAPILKAFRSYAPSPSVARRSGF